MYSSCTSLHEMCAVCVLLLMIWLVAIYAYNITPQESRWIHGSNYGKYGFHLHAKSIGNERRKSRRKPPLADNGQSRSNADQRELLITNKPSLLPPLSGTAESKQAAYNTKDPKQRYLEELFAPAAAGQEPKSVQAAKTITWVAVLVLVIMEIVVSVKVGGMPFDFSKDKATTAVVEVLK